MLEIREVVVFDTKLFEVGPSEAATCNNHSGDLLSPVVVIDAQYAGFLDELVMLQDPLYLLRVDVLPTADDHVIDTINDVEVPVLVHIGNVSGPEPHPSKNVLASAWSLSI